MDSAKLAIERLIALGRVILAAGLLLTALLLPAPDSPAWPLLLFSYGVYLLYGFVLLVFLHRQPEMRWASRALVGDLLVLGVVLLAASSMPLGPLYFVLFVGGLAGARRGWRTALAVSFAVAMLSLLASARATVWQDPANWRGALSGEGWAVLGGLIAGGGLIGYLAERERRYLQQRSEIESVAGLLRLDASWEEVWRRWLGELCRRYQARRCWLTHRDADTDRVVFCQSELNEAGDSYREEERAPRDAAMLLMNESDVSFLARVAEAGETPQAVGRRGLTEQGAAPPVLPVRLLEEFRPQSMLSVAIPVSGELPSRLWLLDAQSGAFTLEQFDSLQQLLALLTPLLANLLTVRGLIARAARAERERIGHDLHDGIAQTVASFEMQLTVLAREAAASGGNLAEELEQLRRILRTEKEGLRTYLQELKSVRVVPGELANWIIAHCAQWQQETGIQVDLLLDPVGPTLPEGVCREVFLMVREALHNVRKHARASRVLVKLRQDENYLRLLVDDDGQGFSFNGTYSQHALEEMGQGPTSICARARSLGATLTIDSTPGSGATLRVDIPLS